MKPLDALSSLESSLVESMSPRSLLANEYQADLQARFEQEGPRALAAFINEHPQIAENDSLLIELLSELVRQQQEDGEPVDPDEVIRWFPRLEHKLRRGVLAEAFIEDHPTLVHQAKAKAKRPRPSTSFPGFRLLEELGKGGAARVYLAAETALGDRPVVLKIAQNGAGEAHLLGRLQHPNIVPVYSVHTDSQTQLTGVCMPYLSSATLFHALRVVAGAETTPTDGQVFVEVPRKRTRTLQATGSAADPMLAKRTYVEAVAHLGAQLADALAYAHTRGIFHRDLKPSNVLLGLDGRPMLMDFNLAADVHSAEHVKGGTIPYMAPEQHQAVYLRDQAGPQPAVDAGGSAFAAGSFAVDARSDIFSLGVILYELLTGKLPFPAMEVKEWRRHMADGEMLEALRRPKSLQELKPQIDSRLAGIVHRCLAFDANERPQTAAELASELRRYLSFPQQSRRWVRRHVRALAAAAVVATSVTVAAAGYVATRPPVIPPSPLELGWEALRQSDYPSALAHFTKATETESSRAEAFYGRGRVFVHQKVWLEASENFQQAYHIKNTDPRYLACLGYSLAQKGPQHWTDAEMAFKEVVKLGAGSAVIYNDLGHCYLHMKPDRSDEAEKWLEQAAVADPNLMAALHNRIVLHVRKAARGIQEPLEALLTDLAKMEAMAASRPVSAHFLLDGARLCALAAQIDSQWNQKALQFLERAARSGLPADYMRGIAVEPIFQSFAANSQFQQILLNPASAVAASKADLLFLDPVQD